MKGEYALGEYALGEYRRCIINAMGAGMGDRGSTGDIDPAWMGDKAGFMGHGAI